MIKKYYISYNESADINYIYLLCLYSIADYNIYTQRYDIINYKSIQDIVNKINALYGDKYISTSTIRRLLEDNKYKDYFYNNKETKQIILFNNIKDNNKFIVLNNKEVEFFIQKKDNLLLKYYIYHKYYCGFNKDKKHDSTIKQMLQALSLSINSNANISKLCNYNQILAQNNFLSISKYKDNNGYERNLYSIVDTL